MWYGELCWLHARAFACPRGWPQKHVTFSTQALWQRPHVMCLNKFDCLVKEMLYIKQLTRSLNVQADSTRAKVFLQPPPLCKSVVTLDFTFINFIIIFNLASWSRRNVNSMQRWIYKDLYTFLFVFRGWKQNNKISVIHYSFHCFSELLVTEILFVIHF